MITLYPLKFEPNYKEKIWGGNKLQEVLNKDIGKLKNVGESWEISAVQDEVSIVSNGLLEGNSLQELIEVYMGDLVGEVVYEKFGMEFPLLIKFIDAKQKLSIQVHPDDELAKKRHKAFGKNEMWYIMDADKDADIITGFSHKMDKQLYSNHFEKGELPEIVNYEKAKPGDAFHISAGRIHAIGANVLLAEIQQTSDITYRVYDWERVDDKGNPRELHTDLALDAFDFEDTSSARLEYQKEINRSVNIKKCEYFTTNILEFDKKIERDYILIDSFVIYMCTEGSFEIKKRSVETYST